MRPFAEQGRFAKAGGGRNQGQWPLPPGIDSLDQMPPGNPSWLQDRDKQLGAEKLVIRFICCLEEFHLLLPIAPS